MWKDLHKLTAKFITYQEMLKSFKYSMPMQLGQPSNVTPKCSALLSPIWCRERPRKAFIYPCTPISKSIKKLSQLASGTTLESTLPMGQPRSPGENVNNTILTLLTARWAVFISRIAPETSTDNTKSYVMSNASSMNMKRIRV
uniref:Uncharacterized protein n=1 Tax=Glossina austeni TaxID=7395 RepID=A0A1A9UGR4_GLOAU